MAADPSVVRLTSDPRQPDQIIEINVVLKPQLTSSRDAVEQSINYEASPEPVTGEWLFLKERTLKVKEEVEEDTGCKFTTFDAISFIKRDFDYFIRVNIGDGLYMDISMREKILNDYSYVDSVTQPMSSSFQNS